MLKPKDVNEYIATFAPEAQPVMEELRQIIQTTIPQAEEVIFYGVPFYKYHGEFVGFAAYKKHISFGFGAGVLSDEDQKLLEQQGYKLGKGTLQIKFNQKIPLPEIQKILKTKAKMNEDNA